MPRDTIARGTFCCEFTCIIIQMYFVYLIFPPELSLSSSVSRIEHIHTKEPPLVLLQIVILAFRNLAVFFYMRTWESNFPVLRYYLTSKNNDSYHMHGNNTSGLETVQWQQLFAPFSILEIFGSHFVLIHMGYNFYLFKKIPREHTSSDKKKGYANVWFVTFSLKCFLVCFNDQSSFCPWTRY